jgi:predicted nucleotidyltransferase component of viral defense system
MNEQALKDRLRLIAKLEKISFQEVWKKLILERLLVRLARSGYDEKFIFKGGLLLSHYIKIGRETKDIDFLAFQVQAETPNIVKDFQKICNFKVNDGFDYSYSDIANIDHPAMNYPGFRIHLDVKFGRMKDRVQVDIGVGGRVKPKQESLELYQYKGKPIFEGSVSLHVYPVETIFSEKLETIISRGAANSRMKDFHDLVLLCREKELLKPSKLKMEIDNTFQNRTTQKDFPITFSTDDYNQLQRLWTAHRNGLGDIAGNLGLPQTVHNLVDEVNAWLEQNKVLN